MSERFSVLLIKKSFNITLLNELLILNYGDVMLVNTSVNEIMSLHSDKITTALLSEKSVISYMERHLTKKLKPGDNHRGFLKRSFAYPEFLDEIIKNITSEQYIHPDFQEAMFFSLLTIFSTEPSLNNLLVSASPTFSEKIRNIFLSDISRQWKLKDVSDYVYMSESLIKKKLLSEKTSFSRILLDVRMISAKKMLEQDHSVMTVSEKCGYASTSYFISIFRQYFSITPRRYSEK
ncbi:helix-turn-helix domain-containing protein [Escherichia coli]|uniref:helix-turn-helix domain-containing protein n=1 Tax=Escherichia coli TaxID=562 RepID=UPI003CFCD26E